MTMFLNFILEIQVNDKIFIPYHLEALCDDVGHNVHEDFGPGCELDQTIVLE